MDKFNLKNVKGILHIERYEGNELDGKWSFENLITDDGFTEIRRMIGGDSVGINNIALGTGNTAASQTDKTLNNKIAIVNVIRDYSISNKIKFLATIPQNTFTNTVSYLEGGLVSKNGTNETLITRLVFDSPIFQKPANSLSMSYELIFT